MTPEEKSLLLQTHELAQENNEMLRSLKRSARFSIIMRVLYWVIIIGISVGAFLFIPKFLEELGGNMEGEASEKIRQGIVDFIEPR